MVGVAEIWSPNDRPGAKPNGRGTRYASAAIHCNAAACAAAQSLAGRRFLLRETPALPLAGCDAQTCTCRYFTYGDRRSFLGNRRAGFGLRSRLRMPRWRRERRSGRDRRKLKIAFDQAPG